MTTHTDGLVALFSTIDRTIPVTADPFDLTVAARSPLERSALPEALRQGGPESGRLEVGVGMTVDEAERRLIAATLQHLGYDKPATAAMLGIGLRTLYRKIKQYGLH